MGWGRWVRSGVSSQQFEEYHPNVKEFASFKIELVLIVAPKLFIEPGTKAPFFKLLSVSGPGL